MFRLKGQMAYVQYVICIFLAWVSGQQPVNTPGQLKSYYS